MNISIEDLERLVDMGGYYLDIIAGNEDVTEGLDFLQRMRDATSYEHEQIAHRKQMAELEDLRGLAVDKAFEEYEMPWRMTVEDTDGWEHILGHDEWTRVFYVRHDDDPEWAQSKPIQFTVRFTPLSDIPNDINANF
jgi:hypothetical protein